MKSVDEILSIIDKASGGEAVTLVAVSKYSNTDEIISVYNQGQRIFGENRTADLRSKKDALNSLDIAWHFIGTLQSNKINQMVNCAPSLWQSCNSLDLAKAVDKRLNFSLDTLLEINVADEESKSGIEINRAIETYEQIIKECPNIKLKGIMTIGAHSDDTRLVQKSFETSYKIYEKLRKNGAEICSMGMSGDFELAIKCGSNMVRLGSILFK